MLGTFQTASAFSRVPINTSINYHYSVLLSCQKYIGHFKNLCYIILRSHRAIFIIKPKLYYKKMFHLVPYSSSIQTFEGVHWLTFVNRYQVYPLRVPNHLIAYGTLSERLKYSRLIVVQWNIIINQLWGSWWWWWWIVMKYQSTISLGGFTKWNEISQNSNTLYSLDS